MKKIFFPLISGFAFAVLLGGCKDFNDQFTGLDDKAKPKNLVKYTYQLVDADYSTISKAALAVAPNAADSALAKSIATNKYFSTSVPGTIYVPFLLKTKYPFGDIGSSAIITSTFGQDKPTYMTDLTTLNIISDADYKSVSVWGDPILYVSAFTPAKSPSAKIPGLLASKFSAATSGTYKFVEYNYSSTEASSGVVDYKYFYDDFETHAYLPSPYAPIAENGWIQKDTSGTKKWLLRTFSSNKYALATSNATNELNNIFLITKKIDLLYGIAPKFTFDVNVGYWNADCLTVLISENFDGNVDHIKSATWVDLTTNFTLPKVPIDTYGTLANAGVADLTAYNGKQVYIAFKYSGDSRTATSPKITTTYQIDNVKISEMRTALSVPSSEKQYVVYKYNGTTWVTPSASDGIFIALQPVDYTAMGLSYISSTNVPLYLPQYLKQKFPYALEGDVKTLVYKSSSTITYSGATQYTMTSGVWTSNTFKINKTEQFIFTVDGWVFDPTVTLDMVASDYLLMVNYVKNTPAISKFYDVKYMNAEYYYGFANNYLNVSFRLSYRDPFFTDPYTQPASLDPELSALTTNADKVALLWTRLQEGMGIFLQLRYPNAIPQISGLDVYYNVRVKVYTPDGVTSSITDTYNYKFKCTASGTPPTFEFVSKTKM